MSVRPVEWSESYHDRVARRGVGRSRPAPVFESAETVILAMATLGPIVSLALQFSNALDLEHDRAGLVAAAAWAAR